MVRIDLPGMLCRPRSSSISDFSFSSFFENKGAVAGVFIAVSLSVCAIFIFIIFALRRRRKRLQHERDASVGAALTGSRSPEDGLNRRSGFSGLRDRSPWPDEDDDEDEMMYNAATGPVMYSNLGSVGPPTHTMRTSHANPFHTTPVAYTPARGHSRSPSPKTDPAFLSSTDRNSGTITTYAGLPYLHHSSGSVSPDPTNSGSALHGTAPPPTSNGHAPSAYTYGTQPPGSIGGSGASGDTLATPHMQNLGPPSPTLERIGPPAYSHSATATKQPSPRIGVAFEPDPVQHNHRITAGFPDVEGFDHDAFGRHSEDAVASNFSRNLAPSIASRSAYSQDGSEWDPHQRTPGEDPRVDPLMRMQGGLVSAASVGPRDHEDYMRRVLVGVFLSVCKGTR